MTPTPERLAYKRLGARAIRSIAQGVIVDATPDAPQRAITSQLTGVAPDIGEEIARRWNAHDTLLTALENIAAEDPLVSANPEAFSIHAFRRCQEIARAAIRAAEGEA